MIRSLFVTLPTLATLLATSPAGAGPKDAAPAASKAPSADQIMQKVEDRSQGKDFTGTSKLAIIPKGGSKRFREYTMLRKDYPDTSKVVMFFSAPADVHGAAFLVWDNKKTEDNRWVYLPTIGQVRQLLAGDSRQSFFGSDFVYEDFTNRDPDQDTHKLIGAQKVDNWDCWVVESTPKNASGLDFATYKTWVWKDKDMIVRQEFNDSSGKVARRLQTVKIDEINGIQTYTQITATNLKTGSESRIEVSDVHYNTGLADERFDQAQLQRGAPSNDKTAPAKKP